MSSLHFAAIAFLLTLSAQADSGPEAPCGSEVLPAYPAVDQPPVIKSWESGELGKTWQPPPCTGWTEPGFSTLVVTVARFRYPAGREDLLRRVAAISELKGLQYWSTTHRQWKTLIVDAFALSTPTGNHQRADFTPQDLAQGQTVFFEQDDSISGKGVYAMHMKSVKPDRLVFDATNLTTLRFMMVPMFHPGELQSIYFLDRDGDVWSYYSILRIGKNANSLTTGHAASSINRAVAFYRHLAAIPPKTEPPAAP